MKEYLLNYNDLTESREIIESKEPRFMAFFIYLIFVLIIGLLIWIWLGEIEDYVIAQGFVLPNQNISIIRSASKGYIKEIHFKDGQKVEQGDLLFVIDHGTSITERDNIQEKKDRVNHELRMLSILERSINENKNLFTLNESEFFYRYMTFRYNYEQLNSKFIEAKNAYFRVKKLVPDILSEEEIEKLELSYYNAETELNHFKSETIFNLRNELRQKEDQILSYQGSLNNVDEKIKLSKVLAPIGGIVQVQKIVNTGEFIASGTEILKIVPAVEANYRIDITVKNQNIGLLRIGQKVKYNFLAFPFQEYGFASGEIKYITKDIIENEDKTYRILGTVLESKLFDRKGRQGNIKPGMTCEARIIIKKKKIIHVVLEKLDLITDM